jgi:hypothetical protein
VEVTEEPDLRSRPVQLDGIHHITCTTADTPRNDDFYARALPNCADRGEET